MRIKMSTIKNAINHKKTPEDFKELLHSYAGNDTEKLGKTIIFCINDDSSRYLQHELQLLDEMIDFNDVEFIEFRRFNNNDAYVRRINEFADSHSYKQCANVAGYSIVFHRNRNKTINFHLEVDASDAKLKRLAIGIHQLFLGNVDYIENNLFLNCNDDITVLCDAVNAKNKLKALMLFRKAFWDITSEEIDKIIDNMKTDENK